MSEIIKEYCSKEGSVEGVGICVCKHSEDLYTVDFGGSIMYVTYDAQSAIWAAKGLKKYRRDDFINIGMCKYIGIMNKLKKDGAK